MLVNAYINAWRHANILRKFPTPLSSLRQIQIAMIIRTCRVAMDPSPKVIDDNFSHIPQCLPLCAQTKFSRIHRMSDHCGCSKLRVFSGLPCRACIMTASSKSQSTAQLSSWPCCRAERTQLATTGTHSALGTVPRLLRWILAFEMSAITV